MVSHPKIFTLLTYIFILESNHFLLIEPSVAEGIQPSLEETSFQGWPRENCTDSLDLPDLEQPVNPTCSDQESINEIQPSTSHSSPETSNIGTENNLQNTKSLCEHQIHSSIVTTLSISQNLPKGTEKKSNLEVQSISKVLTNNEEISNNSSLTSRSQDLPQHIQTNESLMQTKVLISEDKILSLEKAFLDFVQSYQEKLNQCIESLENPHTRQLLSPPKDQKGKDNSEEKDDLQENYIEPSLEDTERALGGIRPF